ncbi:hypothetical protein [Allokutzneria oryzae]|uniref:Malonyl-CoA:ACP transacylase (MAT) domain-containing protein n=1 Tax=Allokutzneria oryzae TaxID=1378989 RepID=A0ABV6A6P7_9PSEU
MGQTRLACAGIGYAVGSCGSAAEFERAVYAGAELETGRSWPVERVLEEALRDAAVSQRDECVVTVRVTEGVPKALERAREELADADVVLLCAEEAGGAVAIALTALARPSPRVYATLDVLDADEAVTLSELVKAALCLHHRYLPPGPENGGVSCPWLREVDNSPLRTVRGGVALVGASVRPGIDWHHTTDVVLLPVTGRDTEHLMRSIAQVKEAVESGTELAELVAEEPDAPLRAVFCVTPGSAVRELDRALVSLPRAHAEGKDWASPTGSYCAARPIGADGKVAVVYPGLFTLYPGLSRDLMRRFPLLHTELEKFGGAVGHAGYRDLAQRLLGRISGAEDEAALERELFGDLAALCAIGVVYSSAHTRLLRELLGHRDIGALGYSLGEVSMSVAAREDSHDLWALEDVELMEKLRDGIDAAHREVRQRWRIPESEQRPVWGSRVLVTDPGRVRAAVSGRERVFLSHINTPNEVVISGDPVECAAVAAELGVPSMPSAHSHIFHTPLMTPAYFGGGFDRRLTPDPEIELFSAYENRPLPRGTGELGRVVPLMLSRTVDFTRLVRAAYVAGYRYFLEVGPGGMCTRWVGDSLAGKPHVAVALERRGTPATTTVAGLLARLASNGVPLGLTPFLPVPKEAP